MKSIYNLIILECTSEFKNKTVLSSLLLYIVSTLFITYLSFKQILDANVWNTLLWIILLFVAVNTSAKAFSHTKEQTLYWYSMVSPQAYIMAKQLYHILLTIVLSFFTYILYSILVGHFAQNIALFSLGIGLGCAGLSVMFVFIGAIAHKIKSHASMMAILGFPVVVPIIITAIKLTKMGLDNLSWSVAYKYVFAMVCLNVIGLILSYILYPFLHKQS
jgi:heme exporter protein B